MGEYYEEKILKNLKNKMGEIEASFVNKTKILNRKKPKKKTVTTVIQPKKMISTAKHPMERKKSLKEKMAKRNAESLLFGTFDINTDNYLNNLLLLDLEKTSKEKFLMWYLTKYEKNDTYYIGYREGTNAFRKRKDEKEGEKEVIIKATEAVDSKIKKSTTKSTLSQLKTYKKRITE